MTSLKELLEWIEQGNSERIAELIREHEKEWSRLKKEAGKLTLRGVNLSGKDLSGADLSDMVLDDVDLSDSNLTGADFSASNIEKTDFSRTYLKEARFKGARMSRSNLNGASYGMVVNEAILTGSVNLFGLYGEDAQYSTSPVLTKKGFRIKEGMEYLQEEDRDYY